MTTLKRLEAKLRLAKLEATVKPIPPTAIPERGPGVVTEERLQRALKAVADWKAAAEARGEPIPAFDWSRPCTNPLLERIRLTVLKAREAAGEGSQS